MHGAIMQLCNKVGCVRREAEGGTSALECVLCPQYVSRKTCGPVRPPPAAGPSEGEEGGRGNMCPVSPWESAT